MERTLKEQRRDCYRKTQPPRLKHRSRGELEEEEGRRPEPRGVVPQLYCSAAPSAWPGGRRLHPPHCLMSLSKRALLPRREVAARQRVVKYSFLVVTCARSDGSSANPPRAIEDRRPDVWSLGRGMGVLGWGGYLALLQGDAIDGEGDRLSSLQVFFVAVGQFSPPGSAKLAILAT